MTLVFTSIGIDLFPHFFNAPPIPWAVLCHRVGDNYCTYYVPYSNPQDALIVAAELRTKLIMQEVEKSWKSKRSKRARSGRQSSPSTPTICQQESLPF